MLQLNSFPYFDDYDASKGYHKILFHPAKPVQARELTQIQSILQEQVKRHGDQVFKNGTVVAPGHVFYDEQVMFLKLETVYDQINIENQLANIVGKTIVGDTNSIKALVLHYDVKTSTDPTTIYIKYTTASNGVKAFVSGETFTCPDIPGLVFKILPVTTYTGKASICTINDGIYYINGYFVGVAKQAITISKYTNTASAVVGLDYVESIVTENDDDTLYDNAFGFTNYGAPGAHRLKITLTLRVKPYDYTAADTTDIKFIDLLKIKAGKIEYLKDQTKYTEIEKWLARRTYEESGDYVVKPFTFNTYNYRNNDRGAWATNKPYLLGDVVSNGGRYYMAMSQGYAGATAPIHTYGIASDGSVYWNELPGKTQFINYGRTTVTSSLIDDHILANEDMIIETSPGKAYVRGMEVEFNSPTASVVPKARETKQLTNAQIYAPAGSYVVVNNVTGLPNVSTNLTKLTIKNVAGTSIGTAWARALEYLTGDLGTPATVEYRLFVFGVSMNAGYNFVRDAHTVTSTVFAADIKATVGAISGSVSGSGTTTVKGVGTYFDFELAVGDMVKIGSSWVKVDAIVSPTQFTASANVTTAAGTTIYKGTSVLTRLGDYITKLSTPAINTLRNSSGAIDMQYVVAKTYTFTTTGTTHAITLTNGETFQPTEHIVVVDTGTLGTSLPVNATYSLDTPATTLTIGGLTNATNYKALLLVKRTGSFAKEKAKTVATKTITLTNLGTQLYTNKNISLTEADCIRLIKVTESGDASNKAAYVSTGEIDITRYFTFDNGQRAEFYDVGRIKTTRNNTRPIRITFEYFVHSAGDYFSADSYSAIPESLLGTTKIGNTEYYLPDCLDFRCRISDAGTDFDTTGGASVSDPLSSEATMSTSYSYFLPRTDSIGLDVSGQMVYNVSGDVKSGMKLATITVAAFTKNPAKDVTYVDDQIVNYTMKDIKAIDNRLSNVEYYVALSELEKKTVNTSIKDEFGLERDKNGFLVDEFVNHDITDVHNPDFKAAIDMDAKVCRALSSLDGVQLIEPVGTTNAARTANNYKLTGNVITLPYTEVAMVSQRLCSRAEVIQAYATLDFTGQLMIYPASDNYTNEQYDTAISNSVAAPVTNVVNTTSTVYGGVRYGWGWRYYGYNYYSNYWRSRGNSYGYGGTQTQSATTTSRTTENVTRVTADYTTVTQFRPPKLRARSVVFAAKKLKPSSSMNVFISGLAANPYFTPCTIVQITTTGSFLGNDTDILTDNLAKRTTTVNSYDVIQRGEVVKCATGSAVVVSDETIFDAGVTKRVLYVANVIGTIAGTLTGATSLSTATVVAVTAGERKTNSVGNFYGVLRIPAFTFNSGSNKMLITDDATANPTNATTMADTGYVSNGVVNTHTRHINYESQSVTTVRNNTTNTYYKTYYYGGGE